MGMIPLSGREGDDAPVTTVLVVLEGHDTKSVTGGIKGSLTRWLVANVRSRREHLVFDESTVESDRQTGIIIIRNIPQHMVRLALDHALKNMHTSNMPKRAYLVTDTNEQIALLGYDPSGRTENRKQTGAEAAGNEAARQEAAHGRPRRRH